MSNDRKQPVSTSDDEDPFLIPSGQSGSLVDRLAAEQGWLPNLEPREAAVQLELIVKIVLSGGRT